MHSLSSTEYSHRSLYITVLSVLGLIPEDALYGRISSFHLLYIILMFVKSGLCMPGCGLGISGDGGIRILDILSASAPGVGRAG